MLSQIKSHFYAVTEDYLIKVSKNKKVERKSHRKIEPVGESNDKGNNLDLYA